MDVLDSLQRWHLRRMVVLTIGSRASTTTNEVTMRYFRRTPNSFYPACTQHGALTRIGNDKWRCVAPGCNVGCQYPVEPQR